MQSLTTFKGIADIGEYTISDQFKVNLKTWLDWCMLEIGGFSNATANATSPSLTFLPNGTKLSRLVYTTDPNYTDGTVWQAYKHDLVFETGLAYAYQPIANALYVNSVLTTSGFIIDYPNGRVIFTTPLLNTDIVEFSYSYRYYNVYIADDLPVFKEIVNSVEPSDLLSQSKINLPAIIIEVVANKTSRGYELGGGQWVDQDILFHVFGDVKSDRDKAMDILSFQKNKTFMFFDYNAIFAAGKMPLNGDGSKNSSGIMYPAMVANYAWKKVFIADARSHDVQVSGANIYYGIVRYKIEAVFSNI